MELLGLIVVSYIVWLIFFKPDNSKSKSSSSSSSSQSIPTVAVSQQQAQISANVSNDENAWYKEKIDRLNQIHQKIKSMTDADFCQAYDILKSGEKSDNDVLKKYLDETNELAANIEDEYILADNNDRKLIMPHYFKATEIKNSIYRTISTEYVRRNGGGNFLKTAKFKDKHADTFIDASIDICSSYRSQFQKNKDASGYRLGIDINDDNDIVYYIYPAQHSSNKYDDIIPSMTVKIRVSENTATRLHIYFVCDCFSVYFKKYSTYNKSDGKPNICNINTILQTINDINTDKCYKILFYWANDTILCQYSQIIPSSYQSASHDECKQFIFNAITRAEIYAKDAFSHLKKDL